MKRIVLLIFFIIVLVNQSCDLNDPDEGNIPAYIHISKVVLEKELVSQGYTFDIKDAWLYVNNKLIGAFELPATIPVLEEGNSIVRVRAGIIENGISNTRTYYHFYSNYEMELELKPMQIDTIYPVVEYIENKTVAWYENFEQENFSIAPTQVDNVGYTIIHDSTPNITHHIKYLKADLKSENDHFEIGSLDAFVLPRGNRPVFLEFDFKTDITLAFGYYVTQSTGTDINTFMFLNPTDEWKKIYINLTPSIAIYELNAGFRMFFGAINEENKEASVSLDNIKLMYLE